MHFLATRWWDLADEAEGKSPGRQAQPMPPVMDRAPMKTPNELRAEAAWLREFAGRVTEREAMAEILVMIAKPDAAPAVSGGGSRPPLVTL